MDLHWVVPPPRMPVTTRIVMFLVGDPYKPSFPLLLGGGTTQDLHVYLQSISKQKTTTSSGDQHLSSKNSGQNTRKGAPACCGWRAGYTNWTSTELNSDEVGDVIEGKLHCWKVQTWESQTPHHLQPHSNHGVPGIDKEVRETWMSFYEGVVYISLYLC